MAVIKNIQSDRLLKSAIVLDLGDLKNQGERLLRQARAEAENIVKDAQRESDRLIGEASDKGHEEGLQRGIEAGRLQGATEAREQVLEEYAAVLKTLQDRWIETLDNWESERNEMMLTAREEILTFAFLLAEKIVHRVIEFNPDVVQDQVDSALRLIITPTSVCVAINPRDREVLENALPGILESIRTLEHIELIEDEAMTRGGCRVLTKSGEVDATIDTQFDRIVETLLPDSKRRDFGSTQEAEAIQEPEIVNEPETSQEPEANQEPESTQDPDA